MSCGLYVGIETTNVADVGKVATLLRPGYSRARKRCLTMDIVNGSQEASELPQYVYPPQFYHVIKTP